MLSSRPLDRFRSVAGTCLVLWATLIAPAQGADVDAKHASHAANFHRAIASITHTEVRQHVELLADDRFEGRDAGSQGGRAASGFIVEQLKAAELKPAGEQGTYYQSFPPGFRNVIGVVPGSDPELQNELIVCCAHYDHVGYGTRETSRGPLGWIHNGADDNASGVAALLEVLQAFHAAGIRPQRSILFAFWDAEERGLLGSRHWLANRTLPQHRVVAAFNIDMIGRLTDQTLEIHGSRTMPGWRQRLVELNPEPSPLQLRFPWKLEENSDHFPFCQSGVPVIMFHTGLHKDYHTPHDDVEKINTEGLHEIAKLTFALVEHLANAVEPFPAFRPEAQQEQQEPVWLTAPVQKPRLGLSWEAVAATPEPAFRYRVTRVIPESPAAVAGIAVGDELMRANGEPITDSLRLRQVIANATETVNLTFRQGESEPVSRSIHLAGAPVRCGIAWKRDPAEPHTVVVSAVVPGSVAETSGIRPLDRIHRLNGQAAANDETISHLVQSQEELQVDLERRGQLVSVRVPLGPPVSSVSLATREPIPSVQ
ncbi:MAG: M20/M25/M40 family metallo-hydrolase [Planctomycetota bacterium]|nr:M20/M25/M40 family metallo-hydrolase [Planctomycetota bacterium]